MDSGEEQGLRAFALCVGCHSGASYPGRPQWIERDGERTEIASIEAAWREEERLGYRVALAGGAHMLLYYIPELDLWSGVMEVRAGDGGKPQSSPLARGRGV
jgi:hypothetical protein